MSHDQLIKIIRTAATEINCEEDDLLIRYKRFYPLSGVTAYEYANTTPELTLGMKRKFDYTDVGSRRRRWLRQPRNDPENLHALSAMKLWEDLKIRQKQLVKEGEAVAFFDKDFEENEVQDVIETIQSSTLSFISWGIGILYRYSTLFEIMAYRMTPTPRWESP
jgi:hypothetical protein